MTENALEASSTHLLAESSAVGCLTDIWWRRASPSHVPLEWKYGRQQPFLMGPHETRLTKQLASVGGRWPGHFELWRRRLALMNPTCLRGAADHMFELAYKVPAAVDSQPNANLAARLSKRHPGIHLLEASVLCLCLIIAIRHRKLSMCTVDLPCIPAADDSGSLASTTQ